MRVGASGTLPAPTADAPACVRPAALYRDQKGYVYEKKAVLHYISSHRGAPVKNPNAGAARSVARPRACAHVSPPAGVTAPLTAAELQPAKNVMRMARRKQLASQQEMPAHSATAAA